MRNSTQIMLRKSIQSQKNIEKNILQLPYVVLDTCFIEALPCIQGEIPLFTNNLE